MNAFCLSWIDILNHKDLLSLVKRFGFGVRSFLKNEKPFGFGGLVLKKNLGSEGSVRFLLFNFSHFLVFRKNQLFDFSRKRVRHFCRKGFGCGSKKSQFWGFRSDFRANILVDNFLGQNVLGARCLFCDGCWLSMLTDCSFWIGIGEGN